MDYIQKRQKLRGAINALQNIAAKENITVDTAALEVVKNRRREVEDYVAAHDVIPATNPATLAMQATMLHTAKVEDKINEGVSNYIEAENAVFQDEADFLRYGETPDNFLGGSLLGSVLAAGKAGIQKLNEKRIAKGKKPVLSGKFWQGLKTSVGDKIAVNRDAEGYNIQIAAPRPVGGQMTDAQQVLYAAGKGFAVSEAERRAILAKEWFQKNSLYIIGAIVLIIGIYFIAKKK